MTYKARPRGRAQSTREVDKWNSENRKHKLEASEYRLCEMERNLGGIHPTVDRNSLKKGKE